MPSFRKTKTPGVYVHEKGCPRSQDDEDARRCRCTPSYRGRRRHPVTKVPQWSPSMKERSEVVTWLAAAPKAQEALLETAAAGPTFRELGEQWLEGVRPHSLLDGSELRRPTLLRRIVTWPASRLRSAASTWNDSPGRHPTHAQPSLPV